MMHTQWFIEEESVVDSWRRCEDVPFNFDNFNRCVDAVTGCHHRYPERGVRIRHIELTDEQYKEYERTMHIQRVLGDIMKQLVCDCGGCKHHGLHWMPEGSGEGFKEAVDILKKAGL